jgi:bifunctional DNase/RNase
MNNQVREVQVKAVLPLEGSFAVFLGTDEKTFVIYVDEPVGTAISMFMRGISKERPLTHDLLASVLMAFGGKIERVVINDVNGSVFYARLIISAENELGSSRKVIELDTRPSDSIAMAVQQGAPVYVADKVWQAVEDVSEALEQIEKRNLDANSNAAVEDPEEEDDDDDEDDEFTEDDLFEDEDEDDDEFDDDEDEHRPGSSTF